MTGAVLPKNLILLHPNTKNMIVRKSTIEPAYLPQSTFAMILFVCSPPFPVRLEKSAHWVVSTEIPRSSRLSVVSVAMNRAYINWQATGASRSLLPSSRHSTSANSLPAALVQYRSRKQATCSPFSFSERGSTPMKNSEMTMPRCKTSNRAHTWVHLQLRRGYRVCLPGEASITGKRW